MAIHPSLLTSTRPATVVPANVLISHIQLRDLILCPRESGVVTYISDAGIVEHDVHAPPGTAPRVIAQPDFAPNTLAALPIPDTNDILFAAGGQEADLHFSYHTTQGSSSSSSSAPLFPSTTSSSAPSHSSSASPSRSSTSITSHHRSSPASPRRKRFRPSTTTKLVWQFSKHLEDCSINNSVVLTTSLGLSRSNESATEPRAIVSNNDYSVKFFDVPVRVPGPKQSNLKEVGMLKLNVPINHTSMSPDARTLLSVGDSSVVHLHHVSGGAKLTFTPITSLTIPGPEGFPPSFWLPPGSLAASFSTAFSADGIKFAVASQEGVVAVWDVRSTKPMKVFQTDKSAGLGGMGNLGAGQLWSAGGGAGGGGWGNSGAGSWLFDDPWHTRGARAPGWSVRNIKFGGGAWGGGKEVMVFTEVGLFFFHSNRLHIVDARTFETEEVVRVPVAKGPAMVPTPLPRPASAAGTTSTTRAGHHSVSRPLGGEGVRSRSSGSTPVNYVYSQLPGFARRGSGGGNVRYHADQQPTVVRALEDTFRVFASAGGGGGGEVVRSQEQRERELREVWERRVQLTRERGLRGRREDGESGSGSGSQQQQQRQHQPQQASISSVSSTSSSRTGYSAPSAIGDSTWRTLRTAGDDGGRFSRGGRGLYGGDVRERGEVEEDEPEAGLVVIPPLGEGVGVDARDVEALFERHAFGVGADRERDRDRDGDGEREDEEGEREDRNTGSAVADFEYPYEFGDSRVWREGENSGRERGEERIDVDDGFDVRREIESVWGGGRRAGERDEEEDGEDEVDVRARRREEDMDVSEGTTAGERRGSENGGGAAGDELDLAGVCFDPSGAKVYVASAKSVVEWSLKGADKRWWSGGAWV
ncbi:hypothetical protein AMATHDRAFT_6350 [Amanita thiersii Skay4041]|uniref:Uncharacterized protein n=1 Tax=Amanita thiersii Skay4041 TaxID=703135 RepID=A0A2A9NJA5_9AGAR|nr:hypothetical protein AMATHDRAFT_6350 [Amanita thiersii Skay4041]